MAPFIEELESNGDILAVRSLGPFAQGILPKLGRKNHEGLGILDQAQGGGSRFKAMFLDQVRVDMKKKDRSLGRVEDGKSAVFLSGFISDNLTNMGTADV